MKENKEILNRALEQGSPNLDKMEKKNLPKIQDLYKDTDLAIRESELQVLLNQPPDQKWIKEHPFIKKEVINVIGICRKRCWGSAQGTPCAQQSANRNRRLNGAPNAHSSLCGGCSAHEPYTSSRVVWMLSLTW